jgi:hypothetical protein
VNGHTHLGPCGEEGSQAFGIRLIGCHGKKLYPMLVAPLDQGLPVFFEILQIGFLEVHRVNGVSQALLFKAIEPGPGTKWKIQFIPVPNLKDYHIMFGVIKVSQAF